MEYASLQYTYDICSDHQFGNLNCSHEFDDFQSTDLETDCCKLLFIEICVDRVFCLEKGIYLLKPKWSVYFVLAENPDTETRDQVRTALTNFSETNKPADRRLEIGFQSNKKSLFYVNPKIDYTMLEKLFKPLLKPDLATLDLSKVNFCPYQNMLHASIDTGDDAEKMMATYLEIGSSESTLSAQNYHGYWVFVNKLYPSMIVVDFNKQRQK